MPNPKQPIALNRASLARARAILLVWIALAIGFVAVTLSPLKSGFAEKARFEGPGDVALYNAEIQRIRQGESYYQAAGAELRSRGFPTRSVFNWRTPAPMWLIGALPGAAGWFLIAGLATLLVAVTLLVAGGGNAPRSLGCALLMFGAVMPCYFDEVFVMPVLWAGVLIGLSVCAYGLGFWRLGVAAGLAALFCRDLAAGYCLLCVVLAVWERRWREVAVWSLGIVAYAAFFTFHAAQVHALQGPAELAHEGSWFQFGGAGFVLSTVQMNAYLLVAPQWVAALLFVASLMGLAGWNSPLGTRVGLAVCGYIAGFAVIGHPFNQYWGSLIAPLLCFGVVWFPQAARRLWSDCHWEMLLARRGSVARG